MCDGVFSKGVPKSISNGLRMIGGSKTGNSVMRLVVRSHDSLFQLQNGWVVIDEGREVVLIHLAPAVTRSLTISVDREGTSVVKMLQSEVGFVVPAVVSHSLKHDDQGKVMDLLKLPSNLDVITARLHACILDENTEPLSEPILDVGAPVNDTFHWASNVLY